VCVLDFEYTGASEDSANVGAIGLALESLAWGELSLQCASFIPPDHHHRNNAGPYRSTSLIRNSAPLGPYRRTMPRAQWKP